ncbi:sulfate transporter family-domain-containing protein [Dichotomocladium elegans]|nr:sulfate transporter family-domain-containing protein [Dichotomocladium elegans]
MTGSAFTIVFSQLPSLNGTQKHVNTHLSPFRVLTGFLSNLPSTRLDAVFGIVALVCLYIIKHVCSRLDKPGASHLSIMRSGIIVVFGTLVSYWINVGRSTSPIQIVRDVPSGFDSVHIPRLNMEVLNHVMSIIPSILIILIIEHISVAKTFGRLSGYNIDPNQEIKSIGASNVVGSFFGAYPCTGAFSRTAIMNRSGAMTPIAGVFSGAVILLSLYVLTPAFYYIPDAILAATVIHAVSDLVSSYAYVKEIRRAGALDFAIWISAVGVSLFVDVETGIYAAVAIALTSLLVHIARPTPQNLPYTDLRLSVDGHIPNSSKTAFREDILVFRPVDSILYPNADHVAETILCTVKARTRGNDNYMTFPNAAREMDRPCFALRGDATCHPSQHLRAILLDMCAVRRIDATALQALVNLRCTIDTYVGQPVDWHFVNLVPEVRVKLLEFGFGSLRRLEAVTWARNGHSSSCSNRKDGHPCFHSDMRAALLAMDDLL